MSNPDKPDSSLDKVQPLSAAHRERMTFVTVPAAYSSAEIRGLPTTDAQTNEAQLKSASELLGVEVTELRGIQVVELHVEQVNLDDFKGLPQPDDSLGM